MLRRKLHFTRKGRGDTRSTEWLHFKTKGSTHLQHIWDTKQIHVERIFVLKQFYEHMNCGNTASTNKGPWLYVYIRESTQAIADSVLTIQVRKYLLHGSPSMKIEARDLALTFVKTLEMDWMAIHVTTTKMKVTWDTCRTAVSFFFFNSLQFFSLYMDADAFCTQWTLQTKVRWAASSLYSNFPLWIVLLIRMLKCTMPASSSHAKHSMFCTSSGIGWSHASSNLFHTAPTAKHTCSLESALLPSNNLAALNISVKGIVCFRKIHMINIWIGPQHDDTLSLTTTRFWDLGTKMEHSSGTTAWCSGWTEQR